MLQLLALNLYVNCLKSTRHCLIYCHSFPEIGSFDAVIHNAGVYRTSSEDILHVNTVAPYLLTCLINKPKRLIYPSSGMHRSGKINRKNVSYSDSKLHIVLLTKAVARKCPDVFANAVDPGWVPTKMGGPGAPDDLEKGYATQIWVATREEKAAFTSGGYSHHQRTEPTNPLADSITEQEKLLEYCASFTGIGFPK